VGVGRGANNPTLLKKKIVAKPPRNSAGFCGGGQGLSWAVGPRKEEEEEEEGIQEADRLASYSHMDVSCCVFIYITLRMSCIHLSI
jgi:hypothetical protein